MGIRHYPSRPLGTGNDDAPCREIIAPDPNGWDTIAVTEWELRRAEWTDSHPF